MEAGFQRGDSFQVRGAFQSASTRAIVRLLPLLLVSLVLANCTSTYASRSGSNYGVKPSPRIVVDGGPIPKGGGRAMIGKPYVVGGQIYVPQDGKGYVREGFASWYGAAFHGRLTANGEVFDKDAILAAHPTLPLPSYVRVTNLVNRRSLIVRVNDRGPFERSRLLDVSEKVADTLQFQQKGLARVRIEYVGRASLNGSNDRKLLATLRTNGPAGGAVVKPTLLAGLDQAPIQTSTAPLRTASATVGEDQASASPNADPSGDVTETGSIIEREGSGDTRTADDIKAAPPYPPPRPPYRPVLALVSTPSAETRLTAKPSESLSGIY